MGEALALGVAVADGVRAWLPLDVSLGLGNWLPEALCDCVDSCEELRDPDCELDCV